MEDLKRRLDAAVARRDTTVRNRDRVQGRLDSARKVVSEVEEEIRARGVEPDKLDAAIEAVQERAGTLVADLEARIQTTEAALAPFVGDDNR